MNIIKSWSTVPINLELIVDFDKFREPPFDSVINDASIREHDEVTRKARARISESCQTIELNSGGTYAEGNKGPTLYGETDIKTFRKTFGDNIKRGFSLVLAPLILPIPCEAYIKWYQTGDLIIPDTLKDIIRRVDITRFATGSFRELNLWTPKKARKY